MHNIRKLLFAGITCVIYAAYINSSAIMIFSERATLLNFHWFTFSRASGWRLCATHQLLKNGRRLGQETLRSASGYIASNAIKSPHFDTSLNYFAIIITPLFPTHIADELLRQSRFHCTTMQNDRDFKADSARRVINDGLPISPRRVRANVSFRKPNTRHFPN